MPPSPAAAGPNREMPPRQVAAVRLTARQPMRPEAGLHCARRGPAPPWPPLESIEEAQVQERGPAAYIAEFIGTFGLVFAITMAVVLFVPAPVVQPGVASFQPFQDFAVVGLVHAFALFFLIQTLALISGAHFNPAITLGMTAIRQIRVVDAAIYIVMQLAGATLGALLTKALVTEIGKANHYGAPAISLGRVGTTLGAMGAEGSAPSSWSGRSSAWRSTPPASRTGRASRSAPRWASS